MSEKLDPIEVFKKHTDRMEWERRAKEHKWTIDEIGRLKPQEFVALEEYITASNRRRDFLYSWQMNRQEAQAHLESKGIKGEVWSDAELRAVSRDPDLYAAYGKELQRAGREGRIVYGAEGPKVATAHHFAGEGFHGEQHEAFKRTLNEKLERIDNYRRAQELTDEAVLKAQTIVSEGLSIDAVRGFLQNQMREISKRLSENYPAAGLEGYAVVSGLHDAAAQTKGAVPVFGKILSEVELGALERRAGEIREAAKPKASNKPPTDYGISGIRQGRA